MHCHACLPRFPFPSFRFFSFRSLALHFYGIYPGWQVAPLGCCMSSRELTERWLLLQFVCKIVLQIEQERWRKQKAHTHCHTHPYVTHTPDKGGACKQDSHRQLHFTFPCCYSINFWTTSPAPAPARDTLQVTARASCGAGRQLRQYLHN